ARGIAQNGVGHLGENLSVWPLSFEASLGVRNAPRLMGDAAKSHAPGLDGAILKLEASRNRDQGEGVRQAVPDLEITVVAIEPFGRQLDRNNDLIMCEIGVELGRIPGEAMKIGEGNYAFALRTGHMDRGLQYGECHAHIRRMHGDAGLAPAEHRIHAVEAVDRAAACAGLALIARHARVIKVEAASALEEVAAGRRHVAQLRRSSSEDGARKQRIVFLDPLVIGKMAVGHKRADAQTAGIGLLDFREWQAGDVDQPRRPRDILLDEVDEIGAARDEPRVRICTDLLDRIADLPRLVVIEIDNGADSDAASLITSSMAATMFG